MLTLQGAVARTQFRETPVTRNRTVVGLDVHARSVWACTVDDDSGEMKTSRISSRTDEIVRWVKALPGMVEIAYEAGPTGFGLARALLAAGVVCHVLAPLEDGTPGRVQGEDGPAGRGVDRPAGPDR